MSRLLVILTLLAAALPAAAGAQTPAEPPVAVTGAADSLTETTANLNGSVDPNGTATTYHFEYGTSAGYGLVTPEADAGAGTDPVAVKAPITGLTRNTTYHYRLVATNGTVPRLRGRPHVPHGDRPGPAARQGHRLARGAVAQRAADHPGRPQRAGDHRALRVRALDRLRLAHRHHRRRQDRRLQAVLDGDRPPAAEHALPLPRGRHQRRGHHAQPRPLVRHHARADRHQRRARAQQGHVGRRI